MATARVFSLEAFKEAEHLRPDPLVIVAPIGRTEPPADRPAHRFAAARKYRSAFAR
jgi:hypothetical protein